MKKLFLLLLLISKFSLAQIRVSENKRTLATLDGKPFFWLGDTDWELFHRLTREETDFFLETRKKQGFNVIQAVALAEFDGLRKPNRYNDKPLVDNNPTILNTSPGNNPADSLAYDYWDHVDFVFETAALKGLYIGFLPTWGDKLTHLWGDGPIVFNTENAKIYGRILGKRYGKFNNLIWILGGDRPVKYKGYDGNDYNDLAIWRAMAEGIKQGEDLSGSVHHFMTYHHAGGEIRTSNFLQDETWLELNSFQSGHGSRESEPWKWVKADLAKTPKKPTFDMEPCYEDHPVNPWDGTWTRARGYFNDYDVRARVYRSVFAGAAGVTYGHHHIWQFVNTALNPPVYVADTVIPWQIAMNAKGANQMKFLKELILRKANFNRISGDDLILSDKGSSYKNTIIGTKAEDNNYALFYMPEPKVVSIDVQKIQGDKLQITYFNPENGQQTSKNIRKKNAKKDFSPPNGVKDWVLIIENLSKINGKK